jgi:hypothetical protein
MWILGSLKYDALYLYLPGILSLFIGLILPAISETSLFYAFIATTFIDSGHVYTTLWRTYFHPEERRSSPIYFLTPLITLGLFSLWHFSQLPGLWLFVIYSTLFHHVRQFYGLSRWYQSLNKRSDPISNYFLYTLCIVPIIAFHFRPEIPENFYNAINDLRSPSLLMFKIFILLYAFILTSWIVYEIRIWKKGVHEMNRVLSIGFPGIVYGHCFLIGRTNAQVLFPLLIIHGISYFSLLGEVLQKTQKKSFRNFGKGIFVVVVTALIFGPMEAWFEQTLLPDKEEGVLASLSIGLYFTPLFCHYVFDAFIWKRSHREASLIIHP